MNVRVRFAPSPTGFLHIGGLRTALYNFLFARKHGGAFILRIEDTDTKRTVPGGAENIIRTLRTVGLDFDEGPIYQSSRLPLYRHHAEELVKSGAAYRCYCTAAELEAQRAEHEDRHEPFRYDRRCRKATKKAADVPHVIRLASPEGEGSVAFDDVVHGRIDTPYATLDDTVLLKTDGYPTYHLANVVDDHDMGSTHVIRGDEWIPSTPKHVVLYHAFGWEAPLFAHLPLLLNPDRSKLSKRQMDVSVADYLGKGYLPEALLNFVALLGWNPTADREVYALDELVALFDLSKVNKSGAVVNTEKLDWLNRSYMRALPLSELAARAKPFLSNAGIPADALPPQTLERVVALERERIKTLGELAPAVDFIFSLPAYDPALLVWKQSDRATTAERLGVIETYLRGYQGMWDAPSLEVALRQEMTHKKFGTGETLWPLRVALSGRTASPGPFEILAALGREESLVRIAAAHSRLHP